MLKRRQHVSFAQQPFVGNVLRQVRERQFERYITLIRAVAAPREPHLGHAAATHEPQQLIRPHPLVGLGTDGCVAALAQ